MSALTLTIDPTQEHTIASIAQLLSLQTSECILTANILFDGTDTRDSLKIVKPNQVFSILLEMTANSDQIGVYSHSDSHHWFKFGRVDDKNNYLNVELFNMSLNDPLFIDFIKTRRIKVYSNEDDLYDIIHDEALQPNTIIIFPDGKMELKTVPEDDMLDFAINYLKDDDPLELTAHSDIQDSLMFSSKAEDVNQFINKYDMGDAIVKGTAIFFSNTRVELEDMIPILEDGFFP